MKIKAMWKNDVVKTVVIVFLCIWVNYVGKGVAERYQLPLWLDAIGTVFSSYLLGPVCGAIVGFTGNVVFAIEHPASLIYGITSIFIGFSVGYMVQKRYFESFFHAMTVAGLVTIISVIISSIINLALYHGSTGNIWGDGVKDYFLENGYPYVFSVVLGELYLDFLDKLVTILTMFLLIRLYRAYKNGKKRSVLKKGMILFALLVFTANGEKTILRPVYAEETVEQDFLSSNVQTIYNSENGLTCGSANDVAQTGDGILWVGTYAGLYRYNGTAFQLMNEYDEVRNVNCLYVDDEGRLWIGTNDSGVVIMINGDLANVVKCTDGLPSESIRCIVQNADGDYYIGTSNAMVVLSIKVGLSVVETMSDVNYAYRSAADETGCVAAVTADGSLYLLKERNVIDVVSLDGEEGGFYSVAFHENGLLYAGTSKGKVLIYDISSGKFVRQNEVDCSEISAINCIKFDNECDAFLCGANGIGVVSAEQEYIHLETGNFKNSIQNMEIDYQGNVWFASLRHGLLKISDSIFKNLYIEAGMEENVANTTAVWQDCIYVGTDKGLAIIEQATDTPVVNALTEELDGIRIRCLSKDSKGHLWISTFGKGLLQVFPDGAVQYYDSGNGGIGDWIRLCTELKDHTMAVSGDSGLSFIKDGKVEQIIPYGEELGFAQILCLLEQPDGTLLAGTDGNGIVVVKNRKIEKVIAKEDGLRSGVILRIVQDIEDGNVFVVTSNGLCYMDETGIRQLSNFPYYNNYDMKLSEDGKIFVFGSAGVYVVEREQLLSGDTLDYHILNSKVGLSGSITANAWNEVDEEKNLYLSTDKGVFVLNMEKYILETGSYRIKVSQIRLDDEKYPIERGTAFQIERDVKRIEIIPEVINYTKKNPVISYYLEGVDTAPKTVYQSELSAIAYTNIPSGKYVFHLAVVDDRTGEILEESLYKFEKEKSIYDNHWFMIYLVAVGGIFVGWLTWFITRTQIQRTLQLQQSRLKLALQQVQMGNETILAIAKTVDAKDQLTSKHSQRVSEYSVMIAAELGFSEAELENLRKAALLHDIGKIGIPDSILNKPARLTDEEYAVMKTHVMKGAEILKDFTLIDHVVEGARFHHERYDGTGYPDGLKGEKIPLYGRIIAVADAFDAMTANRVYRKKLDFDFVVSEIKRGRGTQFDPKLADIFLKLIDDGKIDVDMLYEES